jgi:hypothetical protein
MDLPSVERPSASHVAWKPTETGKKKKKVKKDPLDVQLDPEVVAFSNWFVDWWLRRGLRAVEAAEAAAATASRFAGRSVRKSNPTSTGTLLTLRNLGAEEGRH